MQLVQYQNKRGVCYLVVVDRRWTADAIFDKCLRHGVDLSGFKVVRMITLFDGDLHVAPGDIWRKV